MTDDSHNASMESNRPRKIWVAVLLSLIGSGVGQVYNGQWKKGAFFFAAELVTSVVALSYFRNFSAFLICLSIVVGVSLYVIIEAGISAARLKEYTLKPFNRWWVYLLCLVLSLGVGMTTTGHYGGKSFEVPSGSMLPTIQIGDQFMAEEIVGKEPVARGDIVIFPYPEEPSMYFVKRVIGLPGETLKIVDKHVFINDAPLSEPYVVHENSPAEAGRDDFGPVTFGPDEYFVMGDNREHSHDSRFWGTLSRSQLEFRALYVYFPSLNGENSWVERFGEPLK